MADAERLAARLAEVTGERPGHILIDLSGLEFISSPGLGVLLDLAHRARRHQGEVKLVHPRPFIRDLLVRTRLAEVFRIFQTLEEAGGG